MSQFSLADSEHMALALRIARRGLYSAHPNPRVGCVLVKDGEVIATGWHKQTGEPHAEINALTEAGEAARGALAYVTLEPCAHQGRTPACTKALADAGVAEVVIAMQDPYPKVSGNGIVALGKAGIKVRVGLMRHQAAALNEGFVYRVTRERPFVRLKVAASIDGATAMANGQSQWITGAEARQDVQKLRASSGAILTGVGTVLEDDPSLTVRDKSLTDMQPMRVVLDTHLRMPPASCMLTLPGTTAVFCGEDANRSALESAGATIYVSETVHDRVDPAAVLQRLAALEVNDVLIEAGQEISGAFLEANLVDELVLYQSPHIMGSETRGMFRTPAWKNLEDRVELQVTDMRAIGNDCRITARPANGIG
jgi:diaminohydroxyphosphoribosylaminopyrimidine deaminase/5-amino-6-(5-phosphoribosylamino)uracil reductase